MRYISKSPEETIKLGKRYSDSLKLGEIVGLNGDLGSGKTQFVKGIGEYFQVKDRINSPTFILVNEYEAVDPINSIQFKINHFDLYRLKNVNELFGIDFENFFFFLELIIISFFIFWNTFSCQFFLSINPFFPTKIKPST